MTFDEWFPTTILCDTLSDDTLDGIQSELTKVLPDILRTDMSNPWKDNVLTNYKVGKSNNIIDEYNLRSFKTKIVDNVNQMLDYYEAQETGFIITGAWVNVYPPGAFQFEHEHPGSDISGVYYYQSNGNDGDIVFRNPNPYAFGNNFDKSKNQVVNYTPMTGKMILFPSWMTHRVDLNKSESDRISIAFNIKLV